MNVIIEDECDKRELMKEKEENRNSERRTPLMRVRASGEK